MKKSEKLTEKTVHNNKTTTSDQTSSSDVKNGNDLKDPKNTEKIGKTDYLISLLT